MTAVGSATAAAADESRAGRSRGRPRDEQASRAILEAAMRQVAEVGFGRMTMESVAAEAGVSRATVYRRFSGKGELVTAAVADLTWARRPLPSADPRRDLIDALADFDACFGEPALEVVGGLMGLREEPGAMARHRRAVVEPRVAYVRALLRQARDAGDLDPALDLDVAVELLMGAVFARRLIGVASDPRWARAAVGALWPESPGSPPPAR